MVITYRHLTFEHVVGSQLLFYSLLTLTYTPKLNKVPITDTRYKKLSTMLGN